MEMGSCNSVEKRMWVCSLVESALADTVFSASKSLACLLLLTGSLLNEINRLSKLTAIDESFCIHELHKTKCPDPDVKDASETEVDEEDGDDKADEEDDDYDAGDEDFSGEGEEGDPEDDPEANGYGGSEDDEDDDDGDDEDGEDDKHEDDVPQPPC